MFNAFAGILTPVSKLTLFFAIKWFLTQQRDVTHRLSATRKDFASSGPAATTCKLKITAIIACLRRYLYIFWIIIL